MSLNWDIENVEDWQKLHEDENEQVVTRAIVFVTMGIDMGEITEDNWTEFYARATMFARISASKPLIADGEPIDFTPAQIKRRIGLRTNVITENRSTFYKRIGYELDRIKRTAS